MDEIIELLKEFEGISSKAAKGIFFEVMTSKTKKEKLIETINKISNDFSICEKCFFYKNKNICAFCDNQSRDKKIICVVSFLMDAQKIYDSNFKGLIHVLNGEINIVKNIHPENLKIPDLFARINMETEIILALNLTFEGEVTANFLATKLKNKCRSVSRIARGIPMGGVLDYIDKETIDDAIVNRKEIQNKKR